MSINSPVSSMDSSTPTSSTGTGSDGLRRPSLITAAISEMFSGLTSPATAGAIPTATDAGVVRPRSGSGAGLLASSSFAATSAASAVGTTTTAIAMPSMNALLIDTGSTSVSPNPSGPLSSTAARTPSFPLAGLRGLSLEGSTDSVGDTGSSTSTANSIWATPSRSGRSFSVSFASADIPAAGSTNSSTGATVGIGAGTLHDLSSHSQALASTPVMHGRSNSLFTPSSSSSNGFLSAAASKFASFSSSSSSVDADPPHRVRAKIRATIRSSGKDREIRTQAEACKEWSGIIARWNEFQLSGTQSSGLQKPSRELKQNQSKLTDLLAQQGIPGSLRPTVWMQMIGNGLQLTQAAFEELQESCRKDRKDYEEWRKQVNSAENGGEMNDLPVPVVVASTSIDSSAPVPPAQSKPIYTLFSLIDQDLPRTFPELAFFHKGGPWEESLRSVLECTGRWRRERELALLEEQKSAKITPSIGSSPSPDTLAASSSSPTALPAPTPSTSTGYVQGMSFLACILFLALGEDEFLIFLTLCNLLENPSEPLSEIFTMREDSCTKYMLLFQQQFHLSLPLLHKHFQSIQLQPDMFLWKWIFSMYSQVLSLDLVIRLWDCFLWECFKRRGQIDVVATKERMEGKGAAGNGDATTAGEKSTTMNSSSSNTSATSRASVALRDALHSAREALANVTSSSSSAATTAAASSNHASLQSQQNATAVPASGSGFAYLFRIALGILSMYSDSLLNCSFEECLYFLQHLPGGKNGGIADGQDTGGNTDFLEVEQLLQYVKEIKMEDRLWNSNRNGTIARKKVHVNTTPNRTVIHNPRTTATATTHHLLDPHSKPDYSGQGSPSPGQ